MNAYAYRALEGPEYIRLIVLHPALSKATPLRIDFVSSKLEDVEGDYDAVSYTWGEPVLTFPLYVGEDGMQVYVTENLDRALRYLRYETRERLLWADAACINQKDNEEKAIQIPLMVQIFRGARSVMAWLDPGGDTAIEQKGMRTVERLSRAPENGDELLQENLYSVQRFLKLPWFNRLWIVQEVVFSLEVRLICGETDLPFSRFIAGLCQVKPQLEASCNNPEDLVRIRGISEIEKLWSHYSRFQTLFEYDDEITRADEVTEITDVVALVEKFALYGCTDPRDRIFALFSMATNVRPARCDLQEDHDSQQGDSPRTNDDSQTEHAEHEQSDKIYMNIDYALSVDETYEAFALARLNADKEGAQLIWEAVFSRQYSPRPITWPSWVPDWRIPPRQTTPVSYQRLLGNGDHGVDLKARRLATGVIRMNIPIGKHYPDETDQQLYNVTWKMSRKVEDAATSLQSQLLQLYRMLSNPVVVQRSDHLPGMLAHSSSKLIPKIFPALLTKIIHKLVDKETFSCEDSDEDDISSQLGRHFARMSMIPEADGAHCGPKPSSSDVQDVFDKLDQNLGDTTTLFCFQDPGTGVHSFGLGDTKIEPGDRIILLGDLYRSAIYGSSTTTLVLRQCNPAESAHVGSPVYQLVGRGYIYDPTSVLLRAEFKKYFHSTEGEKINPLGFKKRWRKFSSFNKTFQKSNYVLNMA